MQPPGLPAPASLRNHRLLPTRVPALPWWLPGWLLPPLPPPLQGPIYSSIEWLDRAGMDLIEAQDAAGFQRYLKRYGNTICGRHPTAVLLHALAHCAAKLSVRFTKYDQSHRCTTEADSSVSYAAAVVMPAAAGQQ